MNIQVEILKTLLKNPNTKVYYQKVSQDKVAISTENCVLYFVDEKEFFLNSEKLGFPMELTEYWKIRVNQQELKSTGKIEKDDFKRNVLYLSNKSGQTIMINEKYLKPLSKQLRFTGTLPNKPVYVYEDNKTEPSAMILPICNKYNK